MIEINLLPKDYRKKSFDISFGKTGLYMLGGAAGVFVVALGLTFWQWQQLSSLDDKIEKARQKESILQKDIRLVDALNDVKQKITHRMSAVERLDAHRSSWVSILEDVARNVPEYVWLARFEETNPESEKDKSKKGSKKAVEDDKKAAPTPPKNPSIKPGQVEGYAFTLNALASFMIKMMRSDYFDEVELVTTNEVSIDDKKAYNFVLSFNVHYLSDESLRSLIASQQEKDGSEGSKTTHKSLN
jgi:Tfp pilus assembly protein PilN